MGESEDSAVIEPMEEMPAPEESTEVLTDDDETEAVEAPAPEETPLAAIQERLELAVENEPTGTSDAGEPEAPEIPAEEAEIADADAETSVGDSGIDVADAEAGPPIDELSAAIAASEEQIGDASPVDAAPASTAEEAPADDEVQLEQPVRYGVPWWPFLVYLGLWVALAGIAIWQLEQLPASVVLYESESYKVLLFAGLVMAAVGPILILAVWLGARTSGLRHRVGLLSSAFFKGALATLVGVATWWGTLMVLDYLRLGRPF